MCCTCGNHHGFWSSSIWFGGLERYARELAAEVHRDFLRDLAVSVWLAARLPAVLEQHGLQQEPVEQPFLFTVPV